MRVSARYAGISGLREPATAGDITPRARQSRFARVILSAGVAACDAGVEEPVLSVAEGTPLWRNPVGQTPCPERSRRVGLLTFGGGTMLLA